MATTKVYVIYYSLYKHVELMAREVQRGANSIEGVEATLWQVPETLPSKVLEKMKAPSKPNDVAVIRPEQLAEADGFLFGFPSRFGVMAAQCKAFFDATHELWATQALAGKPAGIFWSTGFHGGGQELTALTAVTQLAHHGMIFVPLGYTFGSGMFEMNQVKGGSPYGAGTYAADGSRQPTDLELQQAFYQDSFVGDLHGGSQRGRGFSRGRGRGPCTFSHAKLSEVAEIVSPSRSCNGGPNSLLLDV